MLRRTIKHLALLVIAAAAYGAEPETVMVTLHAKPGAEAALAQAIAKHWNAVRRLNLVLDSPHVALRGTEATDKTFFVEVFTWRDAAIPDAAPAEIRAVWDELNSLVESRAGRPGLDIVPVSVQAAR
jgi:hypothetical protein